jgi:hypothetical protein
MSNNCTYNPDFCNATVIFFRYCSSDSFAGDAPNPVFGGWQMRGKRHVAAVLDGMTGVSPNLFNPPLQASSLSTVLVIGDSAGGVATLSNVDFVAQSLQGHLQGAGGGDEGGKVWGAPDASWFLDVPAYGNSSRFPFGDVARSLDSNANMTWNQACMAHNQPLGETWRCFHAQYVVPHITSPLIFHEFLFDSANLGFDGAMNTSDPSQAAWIEAFGQNMSSILTDAANQYNFALLGPACINHTVADMTVNFQSSPVRGVSYGDLLGRVMFGEGAGCSGKGAASSCFLVDTCQGINCNPKCGEPREV